MPRLRGLLLFAVSCSALVALVILRPHAAGNPLDWTGDDLALGASWIMAVGAVGWLALSCVVCVVARRSRIVRVAPVFVRRFTGVAIAGAIVVTPALPAVAANAPKAAVAHDEPVVRALTERTPAPSPAPPLQPARRTGPRSHVVRRGDNLWRIARDELVARGAGTPDDSAVARYWRLVVAANAGTLRSGNPGLIYPGEIVALPEPG